MWKFKIQGIEEYLEADFYQEIFRKSEDPEKLSCFSSIEIISDENYSNFSEVINFFNSHNIIIGDTEITYDIIGKDNLIITAREFTVASVSMTTGFEKKYNVIKIELIRTILD